MPTLTEEEGEVLWSLIRKIRGEKVSDPFERIRRLEKDLEETNQELVWAIGYLEKARAQLHKHGEDVSDMSGWLRKWA